MRSIAIRPLSNSMLETLMEIHEREVMGQDLCDQQTKHIKGLFERKLINTRNSYTKAGKPYVGFYVTEAGKEFLSKLSTI